MITRAPAVCVECRQPLGAAHLVSCTIEQASQPGSPRRRINDHHVPSAPLQWPGANIEGLWKDQGFLDLLGGYALAHAQGGMPVFDALQALKDYTFQFFDAQVGGVRA